MLKRIAWTLLAPGAYPQTTGVTETAERLYIQNLHLNMLGWMKAPGR